MSVAREIISMLEEENEAIDILWDNGWTVRDIWLVLKCTKKHIMEHLHLSDTL